MKILFIEDEQKLAQSLKRSLEFESYAVDIAENGDTALELSMINEYDLIVCDIGLPDTDGLQVIRTLRREGVSVPVLFLTAQDTTADKIAGLDVGGDDYMVKPFEYEELLARMRALLRRSITPAAMPILSVGDLQLDPATHIVTRSGSRIDLRGKEFAVLEYLLRHRGVVISKSQLLEHVWDGEVDPFSNVVDVYIGYVRAKIDKAFPDRPALLHTLRGRGYKIGSK